MNVSVEISTFNRKEILRELLQQLAQQTYPSDLTEVVLSDDGSTDGLIDMVMSITAELPYRLRILRHEHQGPANAHNRGIEAAESEIVIMLAADVLPSPVLVEEHVRSHEEHPAPNVMIAGRLVQSPNLPDTVFQRSWDSELNRIFEHDKVYLKHGFFFVSNISFKKSFMLRYGMFLDWPAVSFEDLELGYRLRRHAMSLQRNKRAVGYHHHPVTLETVINRSYNEGYYWHQFEQHVPEAWVRARAGHIKPSDGLRPYLSNSANHLLKKIVVNDFTIPTLIVPLIKGAEKWSFLAPGMRLFTRMLRIYHFSKGMHDHDHDVPFNSAQRKL